MTLSNVKYNKNIEDFLVENIMETHSESKDENPTHNSEARQIKDLQQTLKSITTFIMSLVMPYVGSCFKLLRMSWYRSINTLRMNLKLVIKKHLCILHDHFTGFDSSSNSVILIIMSKYILLYNLNTISSEFL